MAAIPFLSHPQISIFSTKRCVTDIWAITKKEGEIFLCALTGVAKNKVDTHLQF